MQRKAIAVGEPPPGSARGLGVCDALEVAIAPVQLVWLLNELDEMLRLGLAGEQERATSAGSGDPEDESVDDSEYRLALLRGMRARLPDEPVDESVRFVGPSALVLSVVRAATRQATSALSEVAADRGPVENEKARVLRKLASAAAAWVETLVDCSALVGFNFDSDSDPSQAW